MAQKLIVTNTTGVPGPEVDCLAIHRNRTFNIWVCALPHSNKHSVQSWWAEKLLRMHNMSNPEASDNCLINHHSKLWVWGPDSKWQSFILCVTLILFFLDIRIQSHVKLNPPVSQTHNRSKKRLWKSGQLKSFAAILFIHIIERSPCQALFFEKEKEPQQWAELAVWDLWGCLRHLAWWQKSC